ncbi:MULTISPECIES: hypothetical protein [Vibrio]|uniref:Transposase n=2 Tax=Vibrio cyclitrophicus TaxID=47951 RepID=A0A7Z1S160_9VIBR|nr:MULTISPECIES: hypothetical protein [Vibrio]PMK74277.1 hypothetical protein BCT92_07140 [Vibrio sp. 10N.261.52.E5]PMP19989.1 hypothetical protein BCS91_22030 [Vibrio cyclitrophicus]PMP26125.1 hypothetical protein BCS90_23580 [Vibrio cyclitrophicus]TKF84829.1 hypothetical protein FCV65_04690 [Vibrio sp. F13]
MKQEISLEMLIEAMPKPTVSTSSHIHHKSKKKGSIIDHHRCEILILRQNYHCSYGEIIYWLKNEKDIIVSKTALYNRIKHWEGVGVYE